jgi:uncharacterized repeat protein (TIGR02543 family)
MKKFNSLINWGLALNLIGLGFIFLLILNSWISYGYLELLEILFLLLVLASITINIYYYLGELKNLKFVGWGPLIVSIFMFFIDFYSYQETPLLLILVGSSLLIYSDYKKLSSLSSNRKNSQITNNDYLKRAELFLEDRDFDKTIEYCEKALDQNAQLGLAYLYKLLALNEVISTEEYVLLGKPLEKFINDPLFKRFKQFTPQSFIEIKEKPLSIELEKRNIIKEISTLLAKEDKADNLEFLERKKIALSSIHPYQNSGALLIKLEDKISVTKELIRESSYVEAIRLLKSNNYYQLQSAQQIFYRLDNFKDSSKYIKKIESKLKELGRLRRIKALKFTGKFAVVAILVSIVFNLANTFFFKYYTINLVTNGGPNLQPISLRFNEEVDLPDIQKTGHSFDNWFLDEGLNKLSDINIMPAKNITLYARWIVNTYTINFETNGGSAIQPITLNYGLPLNVPQTNKMGHSLSSWYRDVALTEPYSIPATMPAENITLYAKWTTNQYSINFVTNGGDVIPIQNYSYGSIISLPNGEKTGHSFLGWYTDPSLVTEFSLITMPAENITLYAKWNVNYYKINYFSAEPSDFYLSEGESIIRWGEGMGHNYALTSIGRVFTWGDNSDGQLGNGNNLYRDKPVEITSSFDLMQNDKIVSVSVGTYHSAALSSTGRVFTWGGNSMGQLGDGTFIDKNLPIEITNSFGLLSNDKVTLISLGNNHSSVLSLSGRVFTWGLNYLEQLGNGGRSGEKYSTPGEITRFFNFTNNDRIISLSFGGNHSSAISNFGRVFMWGMGRYGQIGHGFNNESRSMIDITEKFNLFGGDKIISISLNTFSSSAISSAGRVFTWGYNGWGQLGDGSLINKNLPVDITSNFNLDNGDKIRSISLGHNHSSALSSSGRIFMWGANGKGQLGDGTVTSKTIPTEITLEFNLGATEKITTLAMNYFSSVITSEGRVFVWGGNFYNNTNENLFEEVNIPTEIRLVYWTLLMEMDYYYDQIIDELIPNQNNATFDGWYLDSSLINEFVDITMPANNLTLYGKWKSVDSL